MELKPNEVHVWFCRPDGIQDTNLLHRYHSLLSSEEKARQSRFVFPVHRHQYLISRALVRTTLSLYATHPPESWRFSRTEHGRPEIIGNGRMPSLRFNLTHTGGLIACAVVLACDIGVDVENTSRKVNAMQIAKRYFSSEEVAVLTALSDHERDHRFFQYWTLKESFSKAKGMGLTLPLNMFSFYPSDNESWRIAFTPPTGEAPSQWRFWMSQPTPQHVLAVSLHRRLRMDYSLTTFETVPFKESAESKWV